MPNSTLAIALVCGLSFMAQDTLAANLQSYAKINLVQGTEVIMVSQTLASVDMLALAAPAPDGRLQFALAGPAEHQVKVQFGALGAKADWEDAVESPGTQVALRYDIEGFLYLDFELKELSDNLWNNGDTTFQAPGNDPQGIDPALLSSRLILTVIYE
ncbi:MAG: hypothetical protein KOO60_08260 [Gemmatimonadales bacterium]|nr:hypothetical protein [Gemmatimonadales bacterium]